MREMLELAHTMHLARVMNSTLISSVDTSAAATRFRTTEAAELSSIMTDCIIEGRLDDLDLVQQSWCHESSIDAQRDRALVLLLARMQACENAHHARSGALKPDQYEYAASKRGQRFLKIIHHREHQTFSNGYVEPGTGWLWYGSWKSVEKNFPRGSMYTIDKEWGATGLFHGISAGGGMGKTWPPIGHPLAAEFQRMGGYEMRTPPGGNK